MTALDVAFVAAMPLLLVCSALFSGAETALFSLTHAERAHLARTNPAVTALLRDPASLLVTVLLLNMTVNVLYFVIASVLAARAPNTTLAVAIPVVSLVVIILFGEILAKLLAGAHRVGVASAVAPALGAVRAAIGPAAIGLVRFVITPLTRLASPQPPARGAGPEELDALLHQAARSGAISSDERQLLGEVIELGECRVREVMTPRVRMNWAEADASPDDLAALARESGLSRFPVRGPGGSAEILGFVDARRVLAAAAAYGSADPRRFLEPVTYVPETATLDRLLEHFRHEGVHTALVADEHGTLAGLVEIEDAVGRLVPTRSERPANEEDVQMVSLGRWLVPGRLPVREWAHALGPEGAAAGRRVTTVGGLVLARLGRVPVVGDEVRVGGVVLRVERMHGRSVETVRLSLVPEDQP